MNRILNFFPYYKDLLLKGKKNTTIRLVGSNNAFSEGDFVTVTVGWLNDSFNELFKAKILSVKTEKIENLRKEDLEDESPDCRSSDGVLYTLSCIYKTVLSPSDKVKVIKFMRIVEKKE